MRHPGLVAFAVTTVVVVPAALQQLSAGRSQVARLVAPGARSLTIGDVRVDAKLDRGLVAAGGEVKLSLSASAVIDQSIDVEVLLFEAVGNEGDRVEGPAKQIARERVTLEAHPTGQTAASELTFKLRGRHGGFNMDFGHYTFFIAAPETATEMLKKRRLSFDGIPPFDWYEQVGWSGSERRFKRGMIARLDANTFARHTAVKLELPRRAVVDEPFMAKVKVSNPHDHAIKVDIRLQQASELANSRDLAYEDLDLERATTGELELAAKATKEVELEVVAKKRGLLGLTLRADCTGCNADGITNLGDPPLDAIDIVAPKRASR
jgi:hypothetical protein